VLGCQKKNLVVYAPYDSFSDTSADFDTNLGLQTRDKRFLSGTSSLLWSERTATGIYIPELNKNNTFSSTYTLAWNNLRLLLSGRLTALQNAGFNLNPTNDIYRLPDGTTGVYIDNYGSGDYLQYDLSKISDNLENNFSIEIKVRSEALKRSGAVGG
jgi:hypothetical protein